MIRTRISADEELYERAGKLAKRQGVSLAEPIMFTLKKLRTPQRA